jgi:hypothetical protein
MDFRSAHVVNVKKVDETANSAAGGIIMGHIMIHYVKARTLGDQCVMVYKAMSAT